MNAIDLPIQRIQIFGILISLFFVLFVSRLIIKGKLREEYAFVWAIFTFLITIFSLWRKSIDVLGHFFGVYDPPNLFFAIAIVIILFYLLHLSVFVSSQKNKIKILSQQIGVLKNTIDKIIKDQNENKTRK